MGLLNRPPMSEKQASELRIEHDSMGAVRVPKAAKWQAQTQRAVERRHRGRRGAVPHLGWHRRIGHPLAQGGHRPPA
jgi:hypothetical protein